jgi:predicted transcriptional regulator
MSTETTEGTAEDGSRGRPRPQDTIERDDRVHALLVERGPLTRTDIATEMGITPSLAYMSLFRLTRDGRVRRASNAEGEGKSHTWEAVTPAA